MNKQIKQSILSGLAFSWTVLISLVWFATWTDLPTQENWATLNKDIWNQLIGAVNNIWKTQLWVDQTRQDVKAQRAVWTPYKNETWKPIVVNVALVTSSRAFFNFTINWVTSYWSSAQSNTYIVNWTFIVPNWATYSVTCQNYSSIYWWTELR